MERSRRIAFGTLSELFGSEVLNIDKYMRANEIKRLAEESYNVMP